MWTQVGPSPIQVSEIESLMRMMGIEGTGERMKFLRLIQTMDRVEVSFHAEQLKAKSKS